MDTSTTHLMLDVLIATAFRLIQAGVELGIKLTLFAHAIVDAIHPNPIVEVQA